MSTNGRDGVFFRSLTVATAGALAAVGSGALAVAVAPTASAAEFLSAAPSASATTSVEAAAAKAPAKTFPGSRIADIALTYMGEWGGNACMDSLGWGTGQCKMFVNCLIVLAGGKSAADGDNDYARSYLRAGGQEVPESATQRGDIIQWGGGNTYKKHTAIVLKNLGNHKFEVVDSNWTSYETVDTHVFESVNMPDFPKPRFIRMGTPWYNPNPPKPKPARVNANAALPLKLDGTGACLSGVAGVATLGCGIGASGSAFQSGAGKASKAQSKAAVKAAVADVFSMLKSA